MREDTSEERERRIADLLREVVTGLPARPGTIR